MYNGLTSGIWSCCLILMG